MRAQGEGNDFYLKYFKGVYLMSVAQTMPFSACPASHSCPVGLLSELCMVGSEVDVCYC